MSGNIAKQGFLFKQGNKMIKRWQKRYFKLIGHELYYFKQPNDIPNKKIYLRRVDFVALAPEVKRQFAFKINIPGDKAIYLAAESLNESISWIEIIEKWRNTIEDDSEIISLDDFKIEFFGQGNHCLIEKAEKITTKQCYIIKRYDKNSFPPDKIDSMLDKEREYLQSMNPFVTTLRYILQTESSICLLYDYVPNGLLFGRLREEGKFSESRAAFYGSQILLALSYFHQHNVNYGRLLPGNILINEVGYIKVTLPGLTVDASFTGISTKQEYIEYLAPEVISGQESTTSSDFYTLGVLIYEMICGMPPFFDSLSESSLKTMILEEPVRFPYHVSKEARSLIEKLMDKNPEKRLTNFESIKSDPFFDCIDWSLITIRQNAVEWVPNSNDKKYQLMSELINFDKRQ
ncbi:RAC family serine/threonine-protein kinase like protein [Tritrichomonas foetus]|uniref:RAC family serine/threonine-protein kinase like protein n=1 Tax=Tritrichomonas foetus TaxID=1144522 RepID=A0A1J4KXP8_9EUKA|nr:RAC family serine/threonine-protein kinase like protein [Tritrichomonas foetus]|eukprot:OHT16027.1 RAC family serine/threonine-protein kinase like protein [Tritrichomonas foetus]